MLCTFLDDFTYRKYVLRVCSRPTVCTRHVRRDVTSPTPRLRCRPRLRGMPRSHAEKLLTSLPKVAGASRRQQYSASTKRALIEVADRPVHRARVRRHQPRRDRGRGPGHQGRALPPLQRQAGRLRGGLRQGRGRRREEHQGGAAGHQRPVGEGARGAAGVPRDRAGPGVPAGRDPGRARDPGLRAVPRAGGALQLRDRPGHRRLGARGLHLRARRADEADLQPDLLRRDVSRRRERHHGRGPEAGRGAHRGGDPVHPRGPAVAGRAGHRAHRPRGEADPTSDRAGSGLLAEDDLAAVLVGRHQLDPDVAGRHLQRAGRGATAAPGAAATVFFQVPRTTWPLWKSIAGPLPK